MAPKSKVFIASSSEGLDVTTAVRRLLLAELDTVARIEPWTRAFELSATYIETLERVSASADFAILVLTPDDVTTSRKAEKLSPRDNVIFELGLFMGAIGRDRCYLVHENRADLKLPSDLLGVKSATFRRPADGDLKSALDAPCALIAERIGRLGVRHKTSPAAAAAQAGMRKLVERLDGAWWERISLEGQQQLAFMQIEWEDESHSLRLRGDTYDAQGSLVSYWSSVVTQVDTDARKIVYHWQGWYPDSTEASAQDRFHGFGEMQFELGPASAEPGVRGIGRFWDVDETRPERTRVKAVQLRRMAVEADAGTMSGGTRREIAALVVRILRDW